MYYLYHIPGKKIGVTTNLLKRVTKTQGYKSGEYEIILCSDDINFISDQERELQKKFGYKVDITPYNKLLKTKKEMKINITEQTTTFPCPHVHLAEALAENDGMTWETTLGEFKNTEETKTWILANAKKSMFNVDKCFIYKQEKMDAIGDCVVVLTNLSEHLGVNIEQCIEQAYQEIKNRKGKMVNGTFVKDE